MGKQQHQLTITHQDRRQWSTVRAEPEPKKCLRKTSAALPPDQISLRSLPPANRVTVPDPRPPSRQTLAIPATPEPTPDPPATPPLPSLPNRQQADLSQLWQEAITRVKDSPDGEKLAEAILSQQSINPGDPQTTLASLITRLENEMKRVGLKGKIADSFGKIVPHLSRFAIVGDIAISSNPNPAALPWAAVRFILLNLTAGEEIRGKIIEGIVEITILEFECSVYQEVHLASPSSSHQTTRQRLRDVIIEVFALSIRLLGFALQRQRSVMKGMTDAFRIEDFAGYIRDLAVVKVRLHDAGHLCDMYHSSDSRGQLRELHDLVRHDVNEGAVERARLQLKDLLINPKDAFDHIHHPENSFCLEGTRVAVLQDIEAWSSDSKGPRICWLPGLAGTGKSTISRTVARDLKGKSLGASFFFKKGTGNRGDGRFVISIIAYQLALNFPPIRSHILVAAKEDPASAMAPMKVQWQRLVINPLLNLQDNELEKPLVIVIDALDECEEDDRKRILQLLQTSCPAALRVFITSRPELDIEGQFLAHQQVHQEIVLHRVVIGTIEKDITTFLQHTVKEFVLEYNQRHPQKHLQMDHKWPGETRFKQLVQRSFPLFIAAATFIRMIKDRHWVKSPDYKIDFIVQESTTVNSQYEALYQPVLGIILSGCPEEDRGRVVESFVHVVGSFILLASPLSVIALANLLGLNTWEVIGQIDPLRSVIDVPSGDGKIELFHLSFRDYLLSKSAGELQVDEAKGHARLAKGCIDLLKAKLKKNICGLGSPGTRISQIDPVILDMYLPAEIQYACLYWAAHLKLSEACFGDPEEDDEAQTILEFLQTFFSNWMEVLCLIGKVNDSLIILDQLQAIVDVRIVLSTV
ncbi:hypothetical protein ACHAP5_008804 [Fusarium lateritium]